MHEALLDVLTEAVVCVDRQGAVRFMNPAAQVLLGVAHAPRRSPTLASILRGPEIDTTAMLGRCGGMAEAVTWHDQRVYRPDGTGVRLDITAVPVADGTVLELREVEELLRGVREEQHNAEQVALRRLVGGLMHEIKNPLGGLRGAAQLLDRALPTSDLREYTRVIMHEADRLLALTERLRAPARPQVRACNVHEPLERVRMLIEAAAPEGVRLRTDYDPSLPELTADADQLVQVFLNLARNAVEALAGREDGEVRIVTRAERSLRIGAKTWRLGARVEVRDNGPGVPEGLHAQIFFPMVSGKGSSGLGLSIARAIVEAHGGALACASRPGMTVFTVLLPISGNGHG